MWGMWGGCGEPGAGCGAWGEQLADREREREGPRGCGRRETVSAAQIRGAAQRTRVVRCTESGGGSRGSRNGPKRVSR